jgi:hypothetical protein
MTESAQDRAGQIAQIDAEVKRLARAEYDHTRLAFAQIAVSALLDLDDDEAYEACEVGAADGDDGPDAFYVDEDGRRAIVVVAKYGPGGGVPLGRPFARQLEAAYSRVTSANIRSMRGKLGSVARQLGDLRGEEPDYPVEVWGLGFGDIRTVAETELDRIHDDEPDNVVFKIFDSAQILAAIHERQSRDAPAMSEPVTLRLNNHFRYSVDQQPEAIVANLDALELAKLERKYGYRLFQSNVRYLLRGKQKINEDIQNTLQQPEERDHFWYYNNGIAILCDRFDEPETTRGKTTVKVYNLQIVNGCQTTCGTRHGAGFARHRWTADRGQAPRSGSQRPACSARRSSTPSGARSRHGRLCQPRSVARRSSTSTSWLRCRACPSASSCWRKDRADWVRASSLRPRPWDVCRRAPGLHSWATSARS